MKLRHANYNDRNSARSTCHVSREEQINYLPKPKNKNRFKLVVLGLLAQVTLSFFLSRILRSKALVYNSFFFSEQPFYGNYLSLFDIGFSYTVKMALKTA